MRILFDHGTPVGLRALLGEHEISTAKTEGWDRLSNGSLLAAAESAGFELLLTTDRRIRYQQNISSRKISILVLVGCTKWAQVRIHRERVTGAVSVLASGQYVEVEIPFPPRTV